ncbi:hypothetical protein CTAYLR_002749 [Chrysophaeum taylorii]|uniref:Uncharacterized protein n=1 Tax=Chrysophaeum taylorii TaxID=2483200 RepID=A0AAD7UE99_9STRA|nr:hypothetical protein CTAYLR_002749 [Chrysophaeum taylorii]
MMLLLLVVAPSVAFVLEGTSPPRGTALFASGYAAARAAAASAKQAGSPKSVAPVAPPPRTVETMPPRAAPGEPAPSESVRAVLEIMGSRIGASGRPLRKDELDVFLREVDTVLAALDRA